jgi:hypothetical protein
MLIGDQVVEVFRTVVIADLQMIRFVRGDDCVRHYGYLQVFGAV